MKEMTLQEWSSVMKTLAPLDDYVDGQFNYCNAKVSPHFVRWAELWTKYYGIGMYFVYTTPSAIITVLKLKEPTSEEEVSKQIDELPLIDHKRTEELTLDPMDCFKRELMISFKHGDHTYEGQIYLIAKSETYWICSNVKSPTHDTLVLPVEPKTDLEKLWMPWGDRLIRAPENIKDFLSQFVI